MAIRSRELVPDVELHTRNGPMAIVSREQQQSAVMDAVAMLEVAGGMFSVLTVRAPTGFPNEMVTVGGSVTWQDRTNAKPQAEHAANGEVHPAQTTLNEQLADERHELEDVEAEVAGEIGDGLDDPAQDEDISSIPENLR